MERARYPENVPVAEEEQITINSKQLMERTLHDRDPGKNVVKEEGLRREHV